MLGMLGALFLSGSTGWAQQGTDSLFRNYLYDTRTAYFRQLPVRPGSVVFWGDSITHWGDWSELTGSARVLNRGIAGDNSYGLLNRVDEVTRHAPSKLFILVGTNDINVHIPLVQTIRNYSQILAVVRQQSPATEVYVQSVLPINNDLIGRQYYTGTNEEIRRMNGSLDSLAKAVGVHYIDLYGGLTDGTGQLDAVNTYDGLHLSGLGYQKWVAMLKEKGCLSSGDLAAVQAGSDTGNGVVNDEVLVHAGAGAVVRLSGIFEHSIPEMDYRQKALAGPQFIISDDPEYIRDPECIALQERVRPGAVRLYIYNVNGVEKPSKMLRKISAVIRNEGSDVMHVRFLKYSSPQPGSDYYRLGKEGLVGYFGSRAADTSLVVAPGAAVPLDAVLEGRTVSYDELVHGLYEFSIDQPGQVSIVQTAPDVYGPSVLERVKVPVAPSHSNAGRGLFGVCNYRVTATKAIDTKDGAVSLVVADGKRDAWIRGKEGSTGQETILSGNYGVMYSIEIPWTSTDGRGLALVSWNPWSSNNQWCGGMANAVMVGENGGRQEIVRLPAAQLSVGGSPEAVVVRVFRPSKRKKVQTIKILYSPPGASCLPTPLVFIPVNLK